MKIEVGKWYKIANGYKAFIMHKLHPASCAVCPYLGYITSPNGVYSQQQQWDETGCCNINSYQIIEEWKEPKTGVAYVNVYEDGDCNTHLTLKFAEATRTHDCLARVRVEWKEGQFDE